MKTKSLKIWGLILLFILALFIGCYFYKFHNGLSLNAQDWAYFGGYIGGVSTLILSFMAMLVSLAIQKRQEKIDKTQLLLNLIATSFNSIDSMYMKALAFYEEMSKNPQSKFDHNNELDFLKTCMNTECDTIIKCIEDLAGDQSQLELSISSIKDFKNNKLSTIRYQTMRENINLYLTKL